MLDIPNQLTMFFIPKTKEGSLFRNNILLAFSIPSIYMLQVGFRVRIKLGLGFRLGLMVRFRVRIRV